MLLFFINIKEESLGYNGVGFHLTDGRRETRESVTENKPPFFLVRVKRRGKSFTSPLSNFRSFINPIRSKKDLVITPQLKNLSLKFSCEIKFR